MNNLVDFNQKVATAAGVYDKNFFTATCGQEYKNCINAIESVSSFLVPFAKKQADATVAWDNL